MHDLWEENTITWFQKKLARKLEPLVMKESFKIFTMTSTQSLYYLKKYNINTQILPHTIPSCSLHPSPKQKENHKNINILFSGNISPSMNLDALQQFVSIVPLLPENYKVTMLIPLTLQQLKSYNLYHERIHYDWKSSSEARLIQQSSDILFLPLSFKNCSLSEVYTVFATKTLDYLISRTPILIFAPSQSFHAIDAKKKKYALVCDSDNENSLLSQIQILANNKNLRELLVQNALEEATNRSALLWANFLFENLQ
jgi:glycosyltransferase involved in cell wall biosynthesis